MAIQSACKYTNCPFPDAVVRLIMGRTSNEATHAKDRSPHVLDSNPNHTRMPLNVAVGKSTGCTRKVSVTKQNVVITERTEPTRIVDGAEQGDAGDAANRR